MKTTKGRRLTKNAQITLELHTTYWKPFLPVCSTLSSFGVGNSWTTTVVVCALISSVVLISRVVCNISGLYWKFWFWKFGSIRGRGQHSWSSGSGLKRGHLSHLVSIKMESNDDNIAMDPTQRAETGMPESIYELRTCPYNPSHKVGVTRFPMHLVRCRELYPEMAKEMDICFFDSTHHVKRSEMSTHYQLCRSYWEFAEKYFPRHEEDMKGHDHDDGKKRKHKKSKPASLPVVGTYKLHTEKLLPGEVADSEDEYEPEDVAWALIDKKKFNNKATTGGNVNGTANGAPGPSNV